MVQFLDFSVLEFVSIKTEYTSFDGQVISFSFQSMNLKKIGEIRCLHCHKLNKAL